MRVLQFDLQRSADALAPFFLSSCDCTLFARHCRLRAGHVFAHARFLPFRASKSTGFVQLTVQIGAVSPVSLYPTEIANQAFSRVYTQPAQDTSAVHAAAAPVFCVTRTAPHSMQTVYQCFDSVACGTRNVKFTSCNVEMPGPRGPANTHVTVRARAGSEYINEIPGVRQKMRSVPKDREKVESRHRGLQWPIFIIHNK